MDRKIKRQQINEQFIFSWVRERKTARTVFAFLIFSAVIHFLGFYLFRVDYPETVLPQARPDRIQILDPENSEVRDFLQKLHDRVVFLEPPSRAAGAQVSISDHRIRFVPSFAETRPRLKRLTKEEIGVSFASPVPAPRHDLENWKNSVKLSRNLAKRGIAPQTVLDDYLELLPPMDNLRINLSVAPDGKPVEVLVPQSGSSEDDEMLAEAIRSYLRFSPDTGGQGPVPGWIEFGNSSD